MAANLSTSYFEADKSAPVLETTVGIMLKQAAENYPDVEGLVFGEPGSSNHLRWTFSEILDQSENVARALLGKFQPGERVAGLVLVPLNPPFRKQELEYALKQSQASTRIFSLSMT